MPNTKRESLESWLTVLCQMIPGISQAMIKTDADEEPDSPIQWPESVSILDDVISAAELSQTQKKSVTTTLTWHRVTIRR